MKIETEDIELADVSKIVRNGATKIPGDLRKRLQIGPGDQIQWILMKDGTLHLTFIKKEKTKIGTELVK